MVKRKKRNQAHPLAYQLPGPLYSDEGGTLSISQIEDVFALVDWKIVMLDPEVRKARGPFHPVSMFRALSLPFLVKIPNEMALVRALEEHEELRRVCMFSDDHTPTRQHTWYFRHDPKGFYTRVMLKLLIDMAVSTGKLNYDLPFVAPVSINETFPSEARRWREYINGFRFVDIWGTDPKHPHRGVVSAGKSLWEIAKEMEAQNPRLGLSSELPFPAEINVHVSDEKIIRFLIDIPTWLDMFKNRRLYGTDTITNIGSGRNEKQTYVVCNVLVVCRAGRRRKILLSERLSGFGKGFFILPGGKQKENERLENCVKRELREETGLEAATSRPISVYRMKYPGKPQVIVIGAIVEDFSGTLSRREPDQNTDWTWYTLKSLPNPLFDPAQRIIRDYTNNSFPDLTWNNLEAQVAVETQTTKIEEAKQLSFLDVSG